MRAPQNLCPRLSPDTHECEFLWEKSLCRYNHIKDVEMRLSLIFQVGPESNNKYLYKRKAGRNLRHTEEKTGGRM